MTSSDRFPVPVRSAVKSNLTDWCFQNLSKRALNALTVQASTTELDKLFQIFTMRAEKNAFVFSRRLKQSVLLDGSRAPKRVLHADFLTLIAMSRNSSSEAYT